MVRCIHGGLTVACIDLARTFAPGDVIDPDAVVATRPGGEVVTWRHVLGDHLASHFAPLEPAPEPTRRRRATSTESAE